MELARSRDPVIPKVALMVITDGRWDYLQRTLESAFEHLDWPFEQCLLVDDSGEGRTMRIPGWEIVQNPQRRGLAGAIQTGWDNIRDNIDYIFHLEDDFTFPKTVPLHQMIGALETRADLAQVALLRQPWSPEEHAAGGIVEMNPADYTQIDDLIIHRRLFTFNPSIYPTSIVNGGADLEAGLTERLLQMGLCFAYYGRIGDPPRCTHIGVRRTRTWQP